MIVIPKDARLKRDGASERALQEAAREWLQRDKRADGIHASDLLELRRAYYRHSDPRDLSDREVGLFVVGKVLHSFVLGAGVGSTPELGVDDSGSRYSDDFGIWYSTDWDRDDTVAEFKTNRRITEPTTLEEFDTYLEQLLVYLAIKGKTVGKLWVLFLNLKDKETGRTTPTFRCYTITVDQASLVSIQSQVRRSRELLQGALDARDPSGLPLCKQWLCGESNCPWWDQCKPTGRYGREPKQWQA